MPFTFIEAGVSHEVGHLVLEVSKKIWLLCRLGQMALLICNTLGIHSVDTKDTHTQKSPKHPVTRFPLILSSVQWIKGRFAVPLFMAQIFTIKRHKSPDRITWILHVIHEVICLQQPAAVLQKVNNLIFCGEGNILISREMHVWA